MEAVLALEEALTHAMRLGDGAERERRRLDLILQQVYPLTVLGRFQEVLNLLLGERERVERLGDPALTGPYYFWLGRTYGVVGEHERAVGAAERALEEAKRCGDKATMAGLSDEVVTLSQGVGSAKRARAELRTPVGAR